MEVFQMKSIKFSVSSSNFKAFTREFKELIYNMHSPKFGSAELQYDINSEENPEFPLTLTTRDHTIQILVKDVGIGQENNKTLATLKVLEITGFRMGCALCNAIRNESELHITVWND